MPSMHTTELTVICPSLPTNDYCTSAYFVAIVFNNQVKVNEMDKEYSTHGKKRNEHRVLVGKTEGRSQIQQTWM
jgi:hypothetical protein